uniref:poly(ADP-ribose) glycohydrolase n=1 Tax=Culicoides sonorensis TaxID=179676 RepID=A0A336LHU1_CULSO
MALVMLPCDLPWWSVVQKRLTAIEATTNLDILLDNMLKIHDLCNVSLDPDEEERDAHLFDGLKNFVEGDLSADEKTHFVTQTVKTIAQHAKNLKTLRPPRGLSFSLQQQADTTELSYDLVASLLANAFFSTFPKRTEKTHPTLQDFNFTHFFKGLELQAQKAKLRSFLQYFDWLSEQQLPQTGTLKISRKIMTGKQWLTIEDWLECSLPLCSLNIKHEGRIERSKLDDSTMQIVFASARIGGDVLSCSSSQESTILTQFPEMLAALIYVESLEDNEALIIENARQVVRITNTKDKITFERLDEPQKTSFCCIDPEDYHALPYDQFEEDNILRELNKCLIGFRQNTSCPPIEHRCHAKEKEIRENEDYRSRLSPVQEISTPTDVTATIVIKQPSQTSPKNSSCDSNRLVNDKNKRRSYLAPDNVTGSTNIGPLTLNDRKGRFIVLGSSGECLPVNRKPISHDSLYSSCESSNDEFHSAHESPEINSDADDDEFMKRYSNELDTPERRMSFAKKLRDALKSSDLSFCSESSIDENYAVGISISGSQTNDPNITLRRGAGSRGFMLDDSIDDEFYKDSLQEEKEWVEKFKGKQNGPIQRKDTGKSSEYSFSTEFSSELEEVYEQFSKWLEDPIEKDQPREYDPRDAAVLRFASSLLKRTLSESFVGIPLTDGCVSSTGVSAEESSIQSYQQKRNKMILNARSLSLELAKHKHRLAAQLISQMAQKRKTNTNLKTIATGNWGCGSRLKGDAQLKFVIQWMAATVAGCDIIYYTAGHQCLVDTVRRVLIDRKWTVGELAAATLQHSKETLNDFASGPMCSIKPSSFFDKLLGLETPLD